MSWESLPVLCRTMYKRGACWNVMLQFTLEPAMAMLHVSLQYHYSVTILLSILADILHVAVGEDFEAPQNSSIVLQSGGHDPSFWLYVDIIDDDLYEDNESFFLELSSNDSAVVFNRSLTEVIIDNDDSGECVSEFKAITANVLHWTPPQVLQFHMDNWTCKASK